MTVTRRTFIHEAGAAALAAGLARPLEAKPGLEPIDQAPNEIWIDALSACEVGDQGFAEIAKSGLAMLSITLGPAGTPTFS